MLESRTGYRIHWPVVHADIPGQDGRWAHHQDENFVTEGAVLMGAQQVVVHGHVQPDGTLQVEEKVNLPPGPVQVTVEAAAPASQRESTQQVLRDIVARRQAPGLKRRSKEEIDTEIDAMRNEDEERLREIERLYQHSRPHKE
jgi:hypothetical protein